MPVRAPIPARAVEEAKDLILDIVAYNGGEFRGKTRLNKVAYFTLIAYFQEEGRPLTSYPVVRLPFGPCLEQYERLLNGLRHEGRLEVRSAPVGRLNEAVFILTDERETDPSSPRGRAVIAGLREFENMSATQASEYSHELSRSWQETPNSDEMAIYTDLLGEDEVLDLHDALGDAIAGRG